MSNFEHVERNKDSINAGETIAVLWSVDDVMAVAKDKKKKITDEDAKKILFDMQRQHDACVGINWDVIDCHLDNFKN